MSLDKSPHTYSLMVSPDRKPFPALNLATVRKGVCALLSNARSHVAMLLKGLPARSASGRAALRAVFGLSNTPPDKGM